jgi:hypothetical protein
MHGSIRWKRKPVYGRDSKAAQRGEEKPLKVHDHGPDAFRYFAKTEVPHWRLAS